MHPPSWPKALAGEGLAAFGLTEPGGGSDAGAVRTRAVQDGDQWVIDGTKAFITNAGLPRSMIATVAAATGTRPDGRPEVTTIIVPVGTPGFTVGRSYSKVGWHASDTRELVFEPGAGFPYYDTFVTVMQFRSERVQSIPGDLRPRGAFVATALEVDRRPRRRLRPG